jgi:hypothetical protein
MLISGFYSSKITFVAAVIVLVIYLVLRFAIRRR